MPPVDLDADLIPAASAAGLRLGTRLAECLGPAGGATSVEYRPGFDLNAAIDRNTGILIVRDYFPPGSGHSAAFCGPDLVRLQFNAADELFAVWVHAGYRGRAFGRVGGGTELAEVRALFPLFYDDGDELFHPDGAASPLAPPGIAFLAGPDAGAASNPVLGIRVHDWAIMRRTP